MNWQAAKILVTLIVFSTAVDLAIARTADCAKDRNVPVHALDETTWKRLNRIYADMTEGRYGEAGEDLQKMMARAVPDPFLQANLAQALGHIEWTRENYDAALGYFEQALELDMLPDDAHFALVVRVARIYFMQERYQEALDGLQLWLCNVPAEKITSDIYVMLASIYARIQDYRQALNAIDAAIAMDEVPREQWYELKLAAHIELEQFPQAAETLNKMIYRWPGAKLYWTQLAQIYLRLKQQEEALGIMALAYRKGLLDNQSDLQYLSGLYVEAGIPYRAAEILEQGIRDGVVGADQENWTTIAWFWYAAEELEKALSAFEKAGSLATDGTPDLRRGYLLADLERWSEALVALNGSFTKGGLGERMTGEAYLLRGLVYYRLRDFDNARSDWARAMAHEQSRDAAQQWMHHLQLTLQTTG